MTGPRSIGFRLLPADHPAWPTLMQRCTALSHISHPHLLAIHTLGQVKGGLYADSLFCAWDYGHVSLAQRLADAPLPAADLVEMASHLSAALQALHDLDLTHRNLRPQNILQVGTRWCLADAQPDISVPDMLRRAAAQGDLSWLAPEVLEGRYEAAADLWALGAALLQAFASPGRRGSIPAQVAAHLDTGPTRPAGAPPPLDLLFHGLSQPDPQRRYSSWQVPCLLSGQPLPPADPAPAPPAPRRGGTRRGLGRRWGTWADPGSALAWLEPSLAVGLVDGSIALIGPGALRPHRTAARHAGPVAVLRSVASGLVSGGWDGLVVWMDADLSVLATVDLQSPVLAISPDLHVVTADGVVHAVEPTGSHRVGALEPGASAWGDSDGRLAVGTLDGRILWTTPGGLGVASVEACAAAVMAGDVGVAVGWDGSVRRGRQIDAAGAPVRCVATVPDGVVCGLRDGVLLWFKGAARLWLEGHTGCVRALALTPDGQRLASAGQDKQVLVWELGVL